jgi:hypothetical protein
MEVQRSIDCSIKLYDNWQPPWSSKKRLQVLTQLIKKLFVYAEPEDSSWRNTPCRLSKTANNIYVIPNSRAPHDNQNSFSHQITISDSKQTEDDHYQIFQ